MGRKKRKKHGAGQRFPVPDPARPVVPETLPPESPPQPRIDRKEYVDLISGHGETAEKAAEQYDRAVLALATAAFGFAFTVFAKSEGVGPWGHWLAATVMFVFAVAVVASLLSFQLTILLDPSRD